MSHDSQTEAEFLAYYMPEDFARPSVATDVVVLTVQGARLHVLMVERVEHPHRGSWMLPGGFVGMDEGPRAAAQRLLQIKTGVSDVFLEQLYTFGAPQRDPRMRVISVAHIALLPPGRLSPTRGTLCRLEADWSGEEGGAARAVHPDGTTLAAAFDHADILGMALKRLRGRLHYTPIAYEFLPPTFTLRALQEVHEAILGHRVNKPSFRRKVLGRGELVPTGEREQSVGHRPAELYRTAHNP